MIVQQPEGIRFSFSRKPAAWVFQDSPRMFPLPVFLPESQASLLEFDQIGHEYQAKQLEGREFGSFHVYNHNMGSDVQPLYNAHTGFEGQRGVLISSNVDRPNLSEVRSVLWLDAPDAYANRMLVYLIPESKIL